MTSREKQVPEGAWRAFRPFSGDGVPVKFAWAARPADRNETAGDGKSRVAGPARAAGPLVAAAAARAAAAP